jgi:uncharacterized protein involved in exopolysaccharide biosynthesis
MNATVPVPDHRTAGGSIVPRILAASLVVLALGAVLGALGAAVRPDVPAARAEIAFGTVDDEDSAERAVRTQLSLLTSRVLLQPVADELGLPLTAVEDAVRVQVLPDTTVIRVEARAATTDVALRIVSAVVTEYVTTSFAADFPVHGLMPAQLSSPPYVPVSPVTPGVLTGTGVGAALGLVVAGAACLVQSLHRPRW